MRDVKVREWLHALVGLVLISIAPTPAISHHSFAMYDQEQMRTLTGTLTRFIPGANHAQLIFQLVDLSGELQVAENGDPVLWGVETSPARTIAREGVTVESFPLGTVLTVTLHPLRDGRNFGALVSGAPLINCGMTLPSGGCTAETGRIFLAGGDN